MNGYHEEDSRIPSLTKCLQHKSYPTLLLEQLNQFRFLGLFTDAILNVDQEELHCHRCVLAASSPYFLALFSNQFQEAQSAQVTLRDISPWIMRKILDYLYTGELEIGVDTALDYLRTGHMLQYYEIVQACCELLSEHLHPTNCLGIKEFATLYNCEELMKHSYTYAVENFTEVIEKSDELLDLPIDSLIKYLSDDHVNVSKEYLLWKAIKRWSQHDVEKRNKHLLKLLNCLRIEQLSPSELAIVKQDVLMSNNLDCLKSLEPHIISHETCSDSLGKQNYNDKSQNIPIKRGPRPSTVPRTVLILIGSYNSIEYHDLITYDPAKKKWFTLPPLPERVVKASVASSDYNIFVSGGIVNNVLSNKVWRFSCIDKKWYKDSSMLFPRAHHSSTVMDGVLYVLGGVTLDSLTVMPCAEIHAFNISTSEWTTVGSSCVPKTQSVILGFNNTLYELGGQSDGVYLTNMEAYVLDSVSNQLTSTGEHFVLPCNGEPGPLKAVLSTNDLIYLHWKNSGQLISLNTKGRRFRNVFQTSCGESICLAVLEHKVYLLGSMVKEKYDSAHSNELCGISLPKDFVLQACVNAMM